MGMPRKVKPEDSVKRRNGDDPEARKGTLACREAKATLRAVEARLSPAEVASGLLPDQALLDVLEAIALGTYTGKTPPRDAVAAIRLRLEYSVPKPAQDLNVRQVSIQVVDPFGDEVGEVVDAREPAPGITAPRVSRRVPTFHALVETEVAP